MICQFVYSGSLAYLTDWCAVSACIVSLLRSQSKVCARRRYLFAWRHNLQTSIGACVYALFVFFSKTHRSTTECWHTSIELLFIHFRVSISRHVSVSGVSHLALVVSWVS